MEYSENYQNVTQRHEGTKCYQKNGARRLAPRRAAIGLPRWLSGRRIPQPVQEARFNPWSGEGNDHLLQYSCLGNPWTEKPGGLQSTGLPRDGQDRVSTNTSVLPPVLSPGVCAEPSFLTSFSLFLPATMPHWFHYCGFGKTCYSLLSQLPHPCPVLADHGLLFFHINFHINFGHGSLHFQ